MAEQQTSTTFSKVSKVAITTLKIVWIPILFIVAIAIGLSIGYWFITDSPGSEIFNKDVWQNFIEQIKSFF